MLPRKLRNPCRNCVVFPICKTLCENRIEFSYLITFIYNRTSVLNSIIVFSMLLIWVLSSEKNNLLNFITYMVWIISPFNMGLSLYQYFKIEKTNRDKFYKSVRDIKLLRNQLKSEGSLIIE